MPPLINPTVLPLAQDVDTRSQEQIDCEEKGGRWDKEKLVCILPQTDAPIQTDRPIQTDLPEDTQQEPVKVSPDIPEVFDIEGTSLQGIRLPDGRTFTGLNREDIAAIGRQQAEKTAQPFGTEPAGAAQERANEISRKLTLAKNVGFIDAELASQMEEQGLNVRELLSAGGQNIDLKVPALAIAAGFSTAPATAGISVAGGFGVAGVSIINDFQKGVRQNIKDQREDLVSLQTKNLRQRRTAMNNYIQAANMNPAEADGFVAAYNIEKSLIRRDYNTLVKQGNEDLEFWGSDATRQIAEYDVFFESLEPSLDDRMRQAVLKPEPSRAFLSLGDEDEI